MQDAPSQPSSFVGVCSVSLLQLMSSSIASDQFTKTETGTQKMERTSGFVDFNGPFGIAEDESGTTSVVLLVLLVCAGQPSAGPDEPALCLLFSSGLTLLSLFLQAFLKKMCENLEREKKKGLRQKCEKD